MESKCSPKAEEAAQQQSPQATSEGRVVHYVLAKGDSRGAHRAALIVNSLGGSRTHVNLHIHLDSTCDRGHEFRLFDANEVQTFWSVAMVVQLSHVPYDEETKAPGTWHWPERV